MTDGPAPAPGPNPGRRRRLPAVAIGGAVAVLVAVVAVAVLRQPPGPPGDGDRVVLYGDSLSVEAAPRFREEMEASTEADVQVRAAPGLAVCDMYDEMEADVADPATRPAVVVLQFAGNNATACIQGDGGELTGPELAQRYAFDTRMAVELFATRGVRVVIAGTPAAPGLPGEAEGIIDAEYERIVTEWAGRDIGQVRYAPAGATVTGDGGEYVDTLPCLGDEGEAEGCAEGRIAVRAPDRIHFCPERLTDEMACPTYSSGARRYAAEMARVATQALDPSY